ncbi:VanW family protein [Corynebacterium glaucum]|uniref:VanW family protein n=1 Tax=Corynebacterium glaucum TaxID=187491 RepID=UPI002657DC6B|nr:VanW family protein [Corynebacterium glaucum]
MSTVNATTQRLGRGGKIALGVVLGALAVLLAIYVADLAFNRGNVPRGTEVGGVAIGGMSPAEAEAKLEQELGGVEKNAVEIRAGSQRSTLVPEAAGLAVDWPATVEAAGVEPMNPFVRLRNLVSTREVDVVTTVDEARFAPEIDRVNGELRVEPIDGSIAVENGRAVEHAPENGQDVTNEVLREYVTGQWLRPEGVEITKLETLTPAIDESVLKDAMQGPVRSALDGPLTVRGKRHGDGEGEVAASIPQERLGEIVEFPVVDGTITPLVHPEAAEAIFAEQLKETETEKQNARVLASGGVEPSVDGIVVDWGKTLERFEDRLLGDSPRDWEATYKEEPANFTTDMAQNATFDQVVGSFTTGGYSGASGTNIGIVARAVNGAIVNPGETFSLNGHTGPRGAAQGYVESGIILNGRADTAVGGGISQFATTLYNASYFAGMTDIAHTAHSYYISRYPAGREATVYEGAIDLQFRNDSPHPVKIETSVGGGEVTVNLMGVKTVNVESVNGGRWAHTSPQEQVVTGSSCIPSSGIPGFTTSDTRIISDLSGNEIKRETQTTVYSPQPIVRCGDSGPAPAPEPPEGE